MHLMQPRLCWYGFNTKASSCHSFVLKQVSWIGSESKEDLETKRFLITLRAGYCHISLYLEGITLALQSFPVPAHDSVTCAVCNALRKVNVFISKVRSCNAISDLSV